MQLVPGKLPGFHDDEEVLKSVVAGAGAGAGVRRGGRSQDEIPSVAWEFSPDPSASWRQIQALAGQTFGHRQVCNSPAPVSLPRTGLAEQALPTA